MTHYWGRLRQYAHFRASMGQTTYKVGSAQFRCRRVVASPTVRPLLPLQVALFFSE
jgi:hypothetical protein